MPTRTLLRRGIAPWLQPVTRKAARISTMAGIVVRVELGLLSLLILDYVVGSANCRWILAESYGCLNLFSTLTLGFDVYYACDSTGL